MSDGSNKDPQRALVFATGDIIVDEPDPYSFFEPSRELLSSGDFVIGQIEVPHTDRGEANSTDIPAPPAAPENLNPLKDCGFNLCTTCGNHAHDNGVPGIVDTLDKLRSLGIAGNRNRKKYPGGQNACDCRAERNPGRSDRLQCGWTEGRLGNLP